MAEAKPLKEPVGRVGSVLAAIKFYFSATRFRVDSLLPDSMEVAYPNGLSGSLPQDTRDVLGAYEVRYPKDRDPFSREKLAYEIGLTVGAGLERSGMLPQRYEGLVADIAVVPACEPPESREA